MGKVSQKKQQIYALFIAMKQLTLLFTLITYILSQSVTKLDMPKKITTSGTFEQGNVLPSTNQTVYFGQFDAYIGYDIKAKKPIGIKIRPDLSASKIVIGDNSKHADWGFSCTEDNSCTVSKNTCEDNASYLGVSYDCINGATNIYFNKDQKYEDFKNVTLDVELTP